MSAGSADPQAGAGPPPGPRFSGPQQALYDALLRKSPRLANMYLGALHVLDQRENPDRLALCAHGLRELMEKLHRIVDLPVEAIEASSRGVPKPTTLRNEVRRLQKYWDKFTGKWDPADPKIRDKGFAADVKTLLQKLRGFFKTVDRIAPERRVERRKLLRGLDPAGQPLAPAIEERLIRQLENLHGFLQSAAHHNQEPSQNDFQEQLLAVEGFLLERLAPRTYDEFAEIDQIIARGKSDAEP